MAIQPEEQDAQQVREGFVETARIRRKKRKILKIHFRIFEMVTTTTQRKVFGKVQKEVKSIHG